MKRKAFTLVEMLIVIGIIMLLAALLLPAIGRARRSAVRTALSADMQAIAAGIDAYRLDFKDIPRPDRFVPGPFQGSAILCWTLIAPGPASFDGAADFGFRERGTQGQVYGPYVTPGNFRLGTVTTSPAVKSTLRYDANVCIADRNGNAILYFPSKLTATSIASVTNYLGPPGKGTRYASKDNDPQVATGTEFGINPDAAGALKSMQLLLPGVNQRDLSLDQSQLLNLPYLLWDAGPDGKFGTSDDVANFQR
ncbi:MAG TPA: type II secretion system protein [Humisphaera sp.]|jgi:type II secretory pathway pseudopilin PulG|nr:type II secretion system protein [Humisphaera sp.]